jgi:hypothetical protein
VIQSRPVAYINHVAFVIDRSGSMRGHEESVVKVFDAQIEHLARRSRELDQETRASVYLFDDVIDCLFYDKDVLRMPSLKGLYAPRNQTAMVRGTLQAISDLKQTPEIYGDHAFLLYVLTDGQENCHGNAAELRRVIAALPDHWTVAAMVPDQRGVHEAKSFGFPAGNVQVWSTAAGGMAEVGEIVRKSVDSYMQSRAVGVRGSKGLFSVDAGAVTSSVVKAAGLKPVTAVCLAVSEAQPIREFVESRGYAYVIGQAFYQLTKPEVIQPGKLIAVRHRLSGRVYTGPDARSVLGLPGHEVRVAPAGAAPGSYGHAEYDIFVQSTSVNRKLVPGTTLLLVR